jgi:hypothetical protein
VSIQDTAATIAIGWKFDKPVLKNQGVPQQGKGDNLPPKKKSEREESCINET